MAQPAPRPDALQKPVRWGLLGTVLWGLLIAAAFVIASSITVVAMVQAGHPDAAGDELDKLYRAATGDGVILSTSTFVTTVVGCLLIAAAIRSKRGARITEYLGLRAVGRRAFFAWLAYAAAFVLATDLLSYVLGRPVVPSFVRDAYATAQPLWMLWIAFVVAAPVFEEAFFRGFLLAGLRPTALGSAGAVLLTAIVWGLLHTQYDALHVATIVLYGVLLGWARVRSGSLLVPAGMHASSNFIALVEAAVL